LHAFLVVARLLRVEPPAPRCSGAKAETLWHPAAGAWSYGEFELTSLRYNVGR
jgi:hypothetical protein